MKCCQNEWEQELQLPFKYILILDFYDGVISGITTCAKCGRGYLFDLLTWDYETQDNRIFGFTEINISAERLVELLGIANSMKSCSHGGRDYLSVPANCHFEDFVVLQSDSPSHICTSENSLETGIWKRAFPMRGERNWKRKI